MLYKLKQVSGKRHQLRVHMLALGLPLEDDLFHSKELRGEGAPEGLSQAFQLLPQPALSNVACSPGIKTQVRWSTNRFEFGALPDGQQ